MEAYRIHLWQTGLWGHHDIKIILSPSMFLQMERNTSHITINNLNNKFLINWFKASAPFKTYSEGVLSQDVFAELLVRVQVRHYQRISAVKLYEFFSRITFNLPGLQLTFFPREVNTLSTHIYYIKVHFTVFNIHSSFDLSLVTSFAPSQVPSSFNSI